MSMKMVNNQLVGYDKGAKAPINPKEGGIMPENKNALAIALRKVLQLRKNINPNIWVKLAKELDDYIIHLKRRMKETETK